MNLITKTYTNNGEEYREGHFFLRFENIQDFGEYLPQDGETDARQKTLIFMIDGRAIVVIEPFNKMVRLYNEFEKRALVNPNFN